MKRITAALVLVVSLAAFEIGCGIDREQGILMAAGSYGDVAVQGRPTGDAGEETGAGRYARRVAADCVLFRRGRSPA